ncbi:MAG: dTMP kinase, partial [Campylobacteraceae bacterium]|nr:dTMP kinase [Campylobacteraceae bacterium]
DSIESRGIDYLLNIQDRLKQAIVKMDLNYIFINASEPIDRIATKIDNFLKS